MRILIVLTYYYPHWTGLTQHAIQLAEGMAKRGHIVTVLTTQHDQKLAHEEMVNGVRVIRERVTGQMSRSGVAVGMTWSIPRAIARTDVVVGYLPLLEAMEVGWWAKWYKRKLICIYNGDLILPAGIVNRMIERIYDMTTLWTMRLSSRVVTYTMDYAYGSRLLPHVLGKCWQILPPVRPMRVKKSIVKKLARKIPVGTKWKVGFAGRFVEEKGFDVLLKCIPEVLKRLPGTVFVFAGEERVGYEDFWEKNRGLVEANRESLVFLGKLPPGDMASFYRTCDVFALPSRSECFALTQAEAMMVGTPVVASDIPGGGWPVRATGMGRLVAAENQAALARGIIDVIKRRGAYAKPWVVAKKLFNLRAALDKFEQVVREA